MTSKQKKELLVSVFYIIVLIFLIILDKLFKINVNILYLITYFLIAYKIILKALISIVKLDPLNEHFLMTIATFAAIFLGDYAEACFIMLLNEVGELFEEIASYRSRNHIKSLIDLVPNKMLRLNSDNSKDLIDLKEIKKGDLLLVKEGEKIGVDSIILEGELLVDKSSLTGESIHVPLKEGDSVLSSCIIISGHALIKCEKEYNDSIAHKIIDLIDKADKSKARSVRFVLRFARFYTPIIVLIAAIILLIPLLTNADFTPYLYKACVFLVLSCPCALIISIPLSFVSGLALAAKHKILIKGSNYLEKLAKVDTLVSDKTGTLTNANFVVDKILVHDNYDPNTIYKYLYEMESYSNHPIAKSIVSYFNYQNHQNELHDVRSEIAKGVIAYNNQNDELKLGNFNNKCKYHCANAISLSINGENAACVFINDEIKKTAFKAINELKRILNKIVLLSGDNKQKVISCASKLELNDYYYELNPLDKLNKLEMIMKDAKGLAYIGDGINDAPVLKRADVGISIGKGSSELAMEASDILIASDDYNLLYKAIMIARKTLSTVYLNIFFILGTKSLILLLALLGYSNIWLAIFGDVGVCIISILIATRLLKIKI